MQNLKVYHVGAIEGDSAYLLVGDNTAILCDSGFAFAGEKLAQNIKEILGDRKLDFILLTHSHYDHVLGSPYVKKLYPYAKTVAGEYAANIFEKPSAKALMRELDKNNAVAHGVLEYDDLIDNLTVDIAVKDNDVITLGDLKFTVLALPGHTKCSVGFYLAENRLLIGCETLGLYTGENDVMPCFLVGYEMAKDSIKRVMAMDIETILVPHFGLLEGVEAKIYLKKSLENAIDVTEDILDMLEGGADDKEAFEYFSDRFYKGKLKEVYPLDAMTLNTNIMINLIKKELPLCETSLCATIQEEVIIL